MSEYDDKYGPYPMRIQVMPGSEAEHHYYRSASRHSDESIEREALAPGVTASPQDDLVFRGGKVVPQMGFQNVYLGRSSDFAPGDVESIDDAIMRVIRDEQLKNIIQQYFPGKTLSYNVAESVILEEARPNEMEEADVQNKIVELFDRNLILATDQDRTCFNLILPPETILKLDGSSSLAGLGGYHGSVHFFRGGQSRTLYYSANVYSAIRAGRRNGIPFFSDPWKNVVCTLYHELIEFQTDADVGDAIRQNTGASSDGTPIVVRKSAINPFRPTPWTEFSKKCLRSPAHALPPSNLCTPMRCTVRRGLMKSYHWNCKSTGPRSKEKLALLTSVTAIRLE